ncbi:MAG: hypothetical protein V3S39_05035 [Thermodesulfobacteriota bacterium]
MRRYLWVALVFSLSLALLSPSYAEEVKSVDTFLGAIVTVPRDVPDKPEGIPPLLLFLENNMLLVVYSDPTSLEDIDYAEVFDLTLETTVAIAWMQKGVLFLVRDEGLMHNSLPSGKMVSAPPQLKDSL